MCPPPAHRRRFLPAVHPGLEVRLLAQSWSSDLLLESWSKGTLVNILTLGDKPRKLNTTYQWTQSLYVVDPHFWFRVLSPLMGGTFRKKKTEAIILGCAYIRFIPTT